MTDEGQLERRPEPPAIHGDNLEHGRKSLGPTTRPLWLWLVYGLSLAVSGVSVWGLLIHFALVPPPYGLIPPLNLSEPDGLFVDWQIAAISQDPALCERVVISSPLISAERVNAMPERDGCGWSNAIRLNAVGNIVVNASPIDCGTAAALALWLTNEVTPAAEEMLSTSVTKITHYGTYSCRNIAGTPWRSVHAKAAAIDVAAITTSDGSNLTVRKNWRGKDERAEFLHSIAQGTCRYFRSALSPAYNAAHHDHFHLDRGWGNTCK
jgi:Extensin-like protein C-terminus